MSKAARRTVRQAARLANELDLSSFEAAGIVWHRRVAQQPPAPADLVLLGGLGNKHGHAGCSEGVNDASKGASPSNSK